MPKEIERLRKELLDEYERADTLRKQRDIALTLLDEGLAPGMPFDEEWGERVATFLKRHAENA